MAEPGGKQRKNLNGALTMQKLLEFAMAEFERSGPIDFNLDNVLRESGVSRGSFYHHFGSRSRVIARCEAEQLKRVFKADAVSARALVESGLTGRQILDLLAVGIRENVTPAARARRQQRIQTLGVATTDPELRAVINSEQRNGQVFFVETLRMAAERGLIDPAVDVEGLAFLLQGMFLGLIFIDNLDDDELATRVCETIVDAVNHLLRPNS